MVWQEQEAEMARRIQMLRLHQEIEKITTARLRADLELEVNVALTPVPCMPDNRWVEATDLFNDIRTWNMLEAYFDTLPLQTLNIFCSARPSAVGALARVVHHRMLLNRSPKGTMRILVNNIDGKRFTLDPDSSSTIEKVKLMIQEKNGIPVDEQRLVYSGKQLEDGRYLSDYNITDDSAITLFLRLKGGKPVIYLYPSEPTICHVSLTLAPFWNISHLYPPTHMKDSADSVTWTCLAKPDGELRLDTVGDRGLTLPYLFWEADASPEALAAAGVFKLHDTTTESVPIGSKFLMRLDEILEELHLDYKQRADFITYWMEDFSAIVTDKIAFRFLTQSEIEAAAPLRIDPKPDVVHRVFLLFGEASDNAVSPGSKTDWKKVVFAGGIDKSDGRWKENKFCVLEWGGMRIH